MPRHFRIGPLIVLLILVAFSGSQICGRAQASEDQIRRVRDELAATNGLRGSDLIVILNQQGVSQAIEKLVGLEIKLASGATLRIKSASIQLKPAQALVEIDVQATPGVAVTSLGLHLSGKLGSAEVKGASIKLPFELTDVTLDKGESKGGTFLTRLFSEWLTPKKWNESLPELELPVQLSQEIILPSTEFDSTGDLPMHIKTAAYKLNLDLSLITLEILDGRAVLALNITGHERPAPAPLPVNGDVMEDLVKLSAHLTSTASAQLRFSPEALNWLLSRIADATESDLTIELNKGRLRNVEIRLPVGRVTSFTDIEGGAGTLDVRKLIVEEVLADGVVANLTAVGRLKADLQGKEMGIPYRLHPDVEFAVQEQRVPFLLTTGNGKMTLRPKPDSVVKFQLGIPVDVAGKQMKYKHTLELRADRWFKGLELPDVFSRDVELPRKLSVSKDHHVSVLKSEKTHWALSNIRIKTSSESIQIEGDIR